MTFRKVVGIFMAWLVWIPLSIAGSFVIFGWGAQCAVDSCGPQEPWWKTALFGVWVLGIPSAYTIYRLIQPKQVGGEIGS